MTTLLLYDDAMTEHDPGQGHPERPERLRAIREHLGDAPAAGVRFGSPSVVPREAVERVHPAAHYDLFAGAAGKHAVVDNDTYLSPGSWRAIQLAAGAAVDAIDAVMGDEVDNAFALVRPPGHHAEPGRAMGFCLFNNVAIAAEHARAAHGLERVLVVDWDVHHGNGTQAAFYDRTDVLFFSSHQDAIYPGSGAIEETGADEARGFSVNVPLPGGATDGDLVKAFADVLAPIAESFAPQLVLVSAGFDAHRRDPLAGLSMSEDGFAELCGAVRDIATSYAQGRLVMLLEGGYDLEGLSQSVHECVQVLAGASSPGVPPALSRAGETALGKVVAHQRKHWKL